MFTGPSRLALPARILRTSAGVSLALRSSIRAITPLICAVATEVPVVTWYSPAGAGTEVVAVLPLSVDDDAPRDEPVPTAPAPAASLSPPDPDDPADPHQAALTPTAPVEEPA